MTETAVPAAEIVPAGAPELTWENIVENHSARVYRLAYHLTGDERALGELSALAVSLGLDS